MTGLDRLDPTDRTNLLRQLSVEVGGACAAFDVSWIETDSIPDGTKILVAAGVPRQHDDDELRLVAAARRIAGSDIGDRVSIGIHRGTAFVGDIGHARRRTYTVMGLTPVTAARLTSAAGPAGVLVSAEIVERLRGHYEFGPAQDLAVKGRRDLVRAHTIGRLAERRTATGRSAVVGRRRELAVLEQALADHGAGRGTVLEVVGPPGMGKTHLVSAFLSSAPTPRVYVDGEVALSGVPFAVLAGPLRSALDDGRSGATPCGARDRR